MYFTSFHHSSRSLVQLLLELLDFQVELQDLLNVLDGQSAVGLQSMDEVFLELHDVPALSGQILLSSSGRGEVHRDLSELVLPEEGSCLRVKG